MDFLKKHYEKILLSVVLTGLLVAAVFLSIQVKETKDKLNEQVRVIIASEPKNLIALSFEKAEKSVAKTKSPPVLDLTLSNHVFGPLRWVQTPPPDEKIIPLKTGAEWGPQALVVSNMAPLYLRLSLDNVSGNPDSLKYTVTLIREADPIPSRRGAARRTVGPQPGKNDLFALKEIKSPGENARLVIVLEGETEPVEISKAEPYRRVAGWVADFKYPLENLSFLKRREGDALAFAGESYKIIAIREKEVVILSEANEKRYTVPVRLSP